MITLRRARDRQRDRRGKVDVWHTFARTVSADPPAGGFGILESLDEEFLRPGAVVPRDRHRDAQVVVYVCEGALAHEDPAGHSTVLQAGEFLRMADGKGIRDRERNASPSEGAHAFRISLRPWEAGLAPGHEEKRFGVAERRGALCVVASPDGRGGSLRIRADALIHSAVFEPGHHVVHELATGRSAWLHLVRGEAKLGDVILTSGDGAGVAAERAVSFTASEESEVLLVDLGEMPPGPAGRRAAA